MKRESIRKTKMQIHHNSPTFCSLVRTIGRISDMPFLIFSVTVFLNRDSVSVSGDTTWRQATSGSLISLPIQDFFLETAFNNVLAGLIEGTIKVCRRISVNYVHFRTFQRAQTTQGISRGITFPKFRMFSPLLKKTIVSITDRVR